MRLKLIALSLLFVFLVSFISVYAQETTTDVAETDVEIEQALEETTLSKEEVGLTPDKAGYGLKIALEKIRLALTLNKETRAKLALQLADKRIEEAKLMTKENKLEALTKAKDEHRKLILKVRSNLEVSGESEQDLEVQAGLEVEIEEQETKLSDLENIALIRAQGLSEEQKQRLLALMKEFRNQNAEVKLKISQNKEEIKVKLRAKGINETKIEEREAKFEENAERFANHQVEQSEKMFELASKLIEKASSEKNVTIKQETLELKAKAEVKLNEAKTAVESKEYKKAVELAHESKRLSTLTIASIRGLNKEIIEQKLEIIKVAEKIREERKELKEERKELIEKIKKETKETRDLLKEKRDLLKRELKEKEASNSGSSDSGENSGSSSGDGSSNSDSNSGSSNSNGESNN